YPDTDTLILRLRRWPDGAATYSAANFTVIVSDLGDIVEVEIRGASHFLARAHAAGIPFPVPSAGDG
ncbi:MAG: hypothetical protein RRC07_07555, partial [Anaerolineae bacterium]|nr:hypothetical protein [Anaerolineae bacterium]